MVQIIIKTKSNTEIKKSVVDLLKEREIKLEDILNLSELSSSERDFEIDGYSSEELDSVVCSSDEFVETLKSLPKDKFFYIEWLLSEKVSLGDQFDKKDVPKIRKLLALCDVEIPTALATKSEVKVKIKEAIANLKACKPGDAQDLIEEIKELITIFVKDGGSHEDKIVQEFFTVIKSRFGEDSQSFTNQILWLDDNLSGDELLAEMKKRKIAVNQIPVDARILSRIRGSLSVEEIRSYILAHAEPEAIEALCKDQGQKIITKDLILKVDKNKSYRSGAVRAILLHAPALDIETIKKLSAGHSKDLLEIGHINKDNLDAKLIKDCGSDLLEYPWALKNEKTLLQICKGLDARDMQSKELIESGFTSIRKEVIQKAGVTFLCNTFTLFSEEEQNEIKEKVLTDLKGSDSLAVLKIADYLSDAEFSKVAKTSAKTVDGALEILQASTSEKLRAIAISRLLSSTTHAKGLLELQGRYNIQDSELPLLAAHVLKEDYSWYVIANVNIKIFKTNIDAFIPHIQKLFCRSFAEGSAAIIEACSDEQLARIFSDEDALRYAIYWSEHISDKSLARIVMAVGAKAIDRIISVLDEDSVETLMKISKLTNIPDLNNISNSQDALKFARIAKGNKELATKVIDVMIKEDPTDLHVNDIMKIVDLDETHAAHGASVKQWALKNVDYISHLLTRGHWTLNEICHDVDAFNMAVASSRLAKNEGAVFRLAVGMLEFHPEVIVNDIEKYLSHDPQTLFQEIIKLGLLSKSNEKLFGHLADIPLSLEDYLNISGLTELEAVQWFAKGKNNQVQREFLNQSDSITQPEAIRFIYDTLINQCGVAADTIVMLNPRLSPAKDITPEIVDHLQSSYSIIELYNTTPGSEVVINSVIKKVKDNKLSLDEFMSVEAKGLLEAVLEKMDLEDILVARGFSLINPTGLSASLNKKLSQIALTSIIGEKFKAKYFYDDGTIEITSGSELVRKAFNGKDLSDAEFVKSDSFQQAMNLYHRGLVVELTGLMVKSQSGGVVVRLDINEEAAKRTTEDLSREINDMVKKKAQALQSQLANEIPSSFKWFTKIEFAVLPGSQRSTLKDVSRGVADAENKTSSTFKVKDFAIIKNPQKNSWSVPKYSGAVLSPLFTGEEGAEQLKSVFDRVRENQVVKSIEIRFKVSGFDKIGDSNQRDLVHLTSEMGSVVRVSGVFSGNGNIWSEDGEQSDDFRISLSQQTNEIVCYFQGAFGDGSGLINTVKAMTTIITQFLDSIKKDLSSEQRLNQISSEIVRNLDFESISQSEAKMKLLEAARPLYRGVS